MGFGPLFTELDSRAEVKGSRDPLGLQQIWTRLGRQVIGNLTTVSNSLCDFTTLLTGLWFAQRAAELDAPGGVLGAFLRWEQLAAYSRARVNDDMRFRGTEQVMSRINAGKPIVLSQARDGAILSDQKTYGLWGLYTVPSRESGLVLESDNRLTPCGADFVEHFGLGRLGRARVRAQDVVEAISKDPRPLLTGKRDQILQAGVGAMLAKPLHSGEIAFYRKHLLNGGDNASAAVQATLATLLERPNAEAFELGHLNMARLAEDARREGAVGMVLAERLDRIRACEAVLAPMSRLFAFLLGEDGETLAAVDGKLRRQWGARVPAINLAAFEGLRVYLPPNDTDAQRWLAVAGHASRGEYVALVRELVGVNRAVMGARGGAAWIELEGDRLRVRYREESGRLPTREELHDLWVFPYFIDSLRTIGLALRETP